MKYTKIPEDTFQHIQLGAGILVESFTPASGEIENIIGATSGGNNFDAIPEYEDFGADIDNCPKNTKELKKLIGWEAKMNGSFATVTAKSGKRLVGAADIDPSDQTHIKPRNEVLDKDFEDIWWVGDYSDKNTGENAGFCAIHMMNSLSTGGFKMAATDKAKGKFDYEYMGHYSIEKQEEPPFEIYVKEGA